MRGGWCVVRLSRIVWAHAMIRYAVETGTAHWAKECATTCVADAAALCPNSAAIRDGGAAAERAVIRKRRIACDRAIAATCATCTAVFWRRGAWVAAAVRASAHRCVWRRWHACAMTEIEARIAGCCAHIVASIMHAQIEPKIAQATVGCGVCDRAIIGGAEVNRAAWCGVASTTSKGACDKYECDEETSHRGASSHANVRSGK